MLDRQSKTLRRLMIAAFAAAFVLLPSSVPLAGAQTDEKLPEGAAILDNFVEVSGGKDAYEKLKNRVTKGVVDMPAQGLKFDITLYMAPPNKSVSIMVSDAMGAIKRGVDGELAWETSDLQGPSIKEGDEQKLMLRGALFNADLHWRQLFKKAECVGVENIDEKPCYKVVLTPPEGDPEVRWYDKETGLVVKIAMILKSEMGAIPLESYSSDYKKVDGVLYAHKTRIVVLGMERTMTLMDVKHNVELPENCFMPPEEIRMMLKQRETKKAEEKKTEKKKAP